MIGLVENLRDWKLADASRMLQHLADRKTRQSEPPSRWFFHDDLSPRDLYTYLKARFGSPNGFQMALKDGSTSDNYIHWHWSLECHGHVIEIMGLNFYAEAYAYGVPQPTAAEQGSLTQAIKADFASHGPSMSTIRKSFEQWVLFVNPYERLARVITQFSKRLRALDIENIELPELPTTSEQFTALHQQWPSLQAAYTEALGLSLTLRMNAPVLAECFVNLLIFLLARPEIKVDKRLYDDAIRDEIDLRVRKLHMTCRGFKSQIDASADMFKRFQSLMNGRNDLLHGNIDPKALKYEVVHFDGMIPLPSRYEDIAQVALVNSLIHVKPDVALSDVDTVTRFIEFVLSHLEEDIRDGVEEFMKCPNPGWREDKRRPGVLFSPRIAHGMVGG